MKEDDRFRGAIGRKFEKRPGWNDLELTDTVPEGIPGGGARDEGTGGGAKQGGGGGAKDTVSLPGAAASIVQAIGDDFGLEISWKARKIGRVKAPFEIDISVLREREGEFVAAVNGINSDTAQRLMGDFDVEHCPAAEGVESFSFGRRAEVKIKSALLGQQRQTCMQVGVMIKILVDPQVAGNAHRYRDFQCKRSIPWGQ